ncbi:MAG: hypothetical protein IT198_15265 [Acidimicrobiia bacterium]|nr:hypothetical protein [Acidimicrobiia bacterium]
MAVSDRERVGRGFEQLAHGLEPFVDAQTRRAIKDDAWTAAFVASRRRSPRLLRRGAAAHEQLFPIGTTTA